MKILVQKFGGTSLQSESARLMAIGKIRAAKDAGYHPVVVVSAVGRKGDPYATDTLLDAARRAHIKIPAREKDLLLSCGEIISAVLMTQMLAADELDAVALTGGQAGIITDQQYGSAKVNSVYTKKIWNYLEENKIPVIAGFQGITADFEITTLGRGGSDTTAAIIATALEAEKIEIYSDVEGLMTADPRIVPKARFISEASYTELVELAHKGAKIIHPFAVEQAQIANIPLSIKSTFTSAQGSEITRFKANRPVTAVTSNNNILQFVLLNQKNSAKILTDLAEQGISLDMIDISPGQLSFLVIRECLHPVKKYLLQNGIDYVLQEQMCKISVIGSGMSGVPGVIAKISSALQEKKIEIYKSMDSHTAISCLISRELEALAVQTLHKKFNLEKE